MTSERWRYVLWLGTLGVVLYLAWQALGALLPFIVGAIFAYILTPVVDRAASVIPARSHRANLYRRAFVILILYALIGGTMLGIGLLIVPVASEQVSEFIDTLPDLVDDARNEMTDWVDEYRERVPEEAQERIDEYAEDVSTSLAGEVADAATASIDILTSTLTVLFGFLIVPFWVFYALRDRHNANQNFLAAVPVPLRRDVEHIQAIADQLLGRYIRAQLLLGLVVGTTVMIGLTLMDVQLSIGLGVFAGITEMIPIIGPWLGAAPAIIIVIATDPDLLFPVALFYLLVQQVENNLLVPRVQGHATDLHPAMILLLLAIAGAVFGFWGLVAVVPAAAILRELFWYADRRLSGASPDESMAQTHVVESNPELIHRYGLLPHAPEPDPITGLPPEATAGPTTGEET